MTRPFALVAASLLLLQSAIGLAQVRDGAEVRLVSDAEGAVWVGEKVDVYLELWTNELSFSEQAFTLPEVRGGYLLQPDSTTVKLTERRAGEAWQGLRYLLNLYPQRPGEVRVPSFEVRFSTSGGYGSESTRRSFTTQTLSVDAVLPPDATPGALLVTTTDFNLEASWEPQPSGQEPIDLKTGDALVLTVNRSAAGVPGMVFDPLPVFAADGLGVYPDAPLVRDRVQRGALTGTRTDRVTVICERPGSFVLPGVEFAWWDPVSEELMRRSIPSLAIEVAENPAWGGASSAGDAERITVRWRGYLWIVPVVVLLWWPIRPLLRRVNRWLLRELRPRKLSPLNP